ncbi:MAG: hypothetical protein LBN71_07545, partial [Tannerella sp.]|nr:hypothetical protein [Tannerella sp.]
DDHFRAENLAADRAYLDQLKSFLAKLLPRMGGETKDFYAVSLAHLSLLQENAPDARKYLAMVSEKANPTIRLQQKLETVWLAIKTQDIQSKSFQETFPENIADLERISEPGYDNCQMLYTLTLSLANEYHKKNERVYANLLQLKSNDYRSRSNDAEDDEDYGYKVSYQEYAYPSIAYFEFNSTVADVDRLITLLQKKNRTAFETYLLDQPLASVDVYRDLKGTLAFRNNDLQTAYETFASMPGDFWQSRNGLSSADYLNEDPFVPKGLGKDLDREFDYKFNKAEFVKQLIHLQKQAETDKKADSYIQLGNAYFNTSYFGNAWMMTRYGWSVSDLYYTKTDCLPQWMRDYMTSAIARTCFEKALAASPTDEQRAYASVMLYMIHKNRYEYLSADSDKKAAVMYGNRFATQYGNTKTYRMYECPGIRYFLGMVK